MGEHSAVHILAVSCRSSSYGGSQSQIWSSKWGSRSRNLLKPAVLWDMTPTFRKVRWIMLPPSSRDWFTFQDTIELIACFYLIRQKPYRKRRLQQFIVAARTCLLSRCLATIMGIYMETQNDGSDLRCTPLRWAHVRCHVIHTKFHKNWLRHSKVKVDVYRQTPIRLSHKSTLIFFKLE
jgi:hypothetical protein